MLNESPMEINRRRKDLECTRIHLRISFVSEFLEEEKKSILLRDNFVIFNQWFQNLSKKLLSKLTSAFSQLLYRLFIVI